MNVVFYIPPSSVVAKSVYEVAEAVATTAEIEVFQKIDDFTHRLCRPAARPTAALLVVGDSEDFLKMVSIRPLLTEVPLVLILPDRKKSTISLGFTFYPRFMTYADSNLIEVGPVLERMLNYYDKKNKLMELRHEAGLPAS